MRRIQGVLAVAGIALPISCAADPLQVQRGRWVAEGYCSACHAIGPTGESPHRIVVPFRDLHPRLPIQMLEEASRTGVIPGHDEMPMFELGAERTSALLAYLESLWPLGSAAVQQPNAPAPAR